MSRFHFLFSLLFSFLHHKAVYSIESPTPPVLTNATPPSNVTVNISSSPSRTPTSNSTVAPSSTIANSTSAPSSITPTSTATTIPTIAPSPTSTPSPTISPSATISPSPSPQSPKTPTATRSSLATLGPTTHTDNDLDNIRPTPARNETVFIYVTQAPTTKPLSVQSSALFIVIAFIVAMFCGVFCWCYCQRRKQFGTGEYENVEMRRLNNEFD